MSLTCYQRRSGSTQEITGFFLIRNSNHYLTNQNTLDACGGAGVIVTAGDKSLTPAGKLDVGRPKLLLAGGWGTDKLGRPSVVLDIEGTCMLDLTGDGC